MKRGFIFAVAMAAAAVISLNEMSQELSAQEQSIGNRGGGTSVNSQAKIISDEKNPNDFFEYSVIPFNSFSETDGLPPKLWVTFQLQCGQKLLKVFRFDEEVMPRKKVNIVVHGLVWGRLGAKCGKMEEVTVAAGTTYSGREFSVETIK